MSNVATDSAAIAAAFRALGNPNRLKIYLRIAADCVEDAQCCPDDDAMKRCVGDMARDLDLVPSTVSHHIKELRQAGLIQMERRGKSIHCWVDKERAESLAAFFTAVADRA